MKNSNCFFAFILALASPALGLSSSPVLVHAKFRFCVIEDLSPRPVALTDFTIKQSGATDIGLRTDSDGYLQLDLAAGDYEIANKTPVRYQGKLISWDRKVHVGKGQSLQLTFTQADASIENDVTSATPLDSGTIFRKFRSGVVEVETDQGHGSGFLCDPRGLILTNFHVAGHNRHLYVRTIAGKRYEATFQGGDEQSDVAVLRVAAEVASGMTTLTLAPKDGSLASEGDHVAAIGSPLNQQGILTEGIVSKVEPDAIISDININHGNSGGPLLSMSGNVIGITTFGDMSTQGGPGISGIISIRKADTILATCQSQLGANQSPSATELPVESSVLIPEDMLDELARKAPLQPYFLKNPKNFRTYFQTPFSSMAQQVRYEDQMKKRIGRRYKNGGGQQEQAAEGGPGYFWLKYVGSAGVPLVQIEVLPWPQETGGSQWSAIGGAILGVGTRRKYELRDDFREMELVKDGTVVEPIRRLRIRDKQAYAGYGMSINDVAYAGIYGYDPLVFSPGKIEIRVWKNDDQNPVVFEFDRREQDRIWAEFSGWRELVEKTH